MRWAALEGEGVAPVPGAAPAVAVAGTKKMMYSDFFVIYTFAIYPALTTPSSPLLFFGTFNNPPIRGKEEIIKKKFGILKENLRNKQGWGAGAGQIRVFLAPWSRSRLKKKRGAGAGKN